MHFLTLSDYSREELDALIDLALEVKGAPERYRNALSGKMLALLFLKHSTRTRVSFEAGMAQLGGATTYLSAETTQLSRGETLADTVGVLSRYVDGIVARVFEPEQLYEIARASSVPVINGLTNFDHPCQVLSDIVSILEHKQVLKGLNLVFIGAADNNIVHSFLQVCPLYGIHLTICSPRGQTPNGAAFHAAQEAAKKTDTRILFTNDPVAAVRHADVIYTDVWFSMHEEPSTEGFERFRPYQVAVPTLPSERRADVPSPLRGDLYALHAHPSRMGGNR